MPTEIASKKASRKSWASWFQFRLDTLVMLMVIAAVACVWWCRPVRKFRIYAGGQLAVRTNMRQGPRLYREERPGGTHQGPHYVTKVAPVENGSWELSSGDGKLLCRGTMRMGVPVGRWTWYFPNGKKMSEGLAEDGAAVGVWTTWYESGAKQSEITYQPMFADEWITARKESGDTEVEKLSPEDAVDVTPFDLFPSAPLADPQIDPGSREGQIARGQYLAIRSGGAKFWDENGQLRAEGDNQLDVREGEWRHYDEQGQLIAHGRYHLGLRDGSWIETKGGQEREQFYRCGVAVDASPAAVNELLRLSGSSQRDVRCAAQRRLALLGEVAIPTMKAAIASPDVQMRIGACENLSIVAGMADEIRGPLQELRRSPSASVEARACASILRIDSTEIATFERLCGLTSSADHLAKSVALDFLCEADDLIWNYAHNASAECDERSKASADERSRRQEFLRRVRQKSDDARFQRIISNAIPAEKSGEIDDPFR